MLVEIIDLEYKHNLPNHKTYNFICRLYKHISSVYTYVGWGSFHSQLLII